MSLLPLEHAEDAGSPELFAPNIPNKLDEFLALEERVARAVTLLKAERKARAEAEERANLAEVLLDEQTALTNKLKQEAEQFEQQIATLNGERDQVRTRVERLLGQLDSLEL